jgi:DUF1365 family protein
MSGEIVLGQVMHRRLRPAAHRFAYRVFFLRLPLTRLERCANALFSIERANLFSLRFRDYGPRDGSHPLAWIRTLLASQGLECADGEVWLQTFPRVLGYVFNPVSFWFCEDRAGRTRAILAEVSNTFGERHCYLLSHPDRRAIADGDQFSARKTLHVSPFFTLAGEYRFRFRNAGRLRMARVDYADERGPLLLTSVAGSARELGAARLARVFFSHPLMTFGVIARIHWQAARLWLKRTPTFPKPAPPAQELSR